mgnify:CR=1 FL=1
MKERQKAPLYNIETVPLVFKERGWITSSPKIAYITNLRKKHSCLSEERSDEVSFIANILKNKISRFARNDKFVLCA